MMITSLLLSVVAIALTTHLASLAIAAHRLARPRPINTCADTSDIHPITIVRPVSQCDAYLLETLESTFKLTWRNTEILFCATHDSDPAVPVVRQLLASYPDRNARLLIGSADISLNPKLNNCVKGWHTASHDLVALVDSNVLLPPDYVQKMLEVWDAGCGMVSAPPAGAAPGNYWAIVECAFLNTHQARWQLVADELGSAFAQGKNLMFRKSILEPLGGITALAIEPAEDAAATRVLRLAGYHIRLSKLPFTQPLGSRSFWQLWNRQVRWAKLRHATFPAWYYPEVLVGSVVPFLVLIAGCWVNAIDPLPAFVTMAALWFGGELALGRWMGWHVCARTPFAILTRDLLIPVIWIAGLSGKDFEWQGHRMTTRREGSPATTS